MSVFLDFLRIAIAPSPPRSIQAMGYVKEVLGIRKRYRRCKPFWHDHIQRTHSIIRQGIERCSQFRKAIILGGGLIHDVPYEFLANKFREVILVDVVHPFRSRWSTRHLRNLKRIGADISNTVEQVYDISWDSENPLPHSEPTLFLNDPEVDFTASVNLLSQLPCMPMSYLRWIGIWSEAQLKDYARDLIQAHLDYLSKLPGVVSLITDIERHKLDTSGKIVEVSDLLFGLKPNRSGEEWEWKLAPYPEVERHYSYFRKVIGVPDWKSA